MCSGPLFISFFLLFFLPHPFVSVPFPSILTPSLPLSPLSHFSSQSEVVRWRFCRSSGPVLSVSGCGAFIRAWLILQRVSSDSCGAQLVHMGKAVMKCVWYLSQAHSYPCSCHVMSSSMLKCSEALTKSSQCLLRLPGNEINLFAL